MSFVNVYILFEFMRMLVSECNFIACPWETSAHQVVSIKGMPPEMSDHVGIVVLFRSPL